MIDRVAVECETENNSRETLKEMQKTEENAH
jgi:hypothetical protein